MADLDGARVPYPIELPRWMKKMAWLAGRTYSFLGLQLRVKQGIDKKQPSKEVFHRPSFIQKSGLAMLHEFRNSGDRGGEHNLAARHSLHQDQGNSLTFAGQYD
jgi:hypothetical protein